MEVHATNSETKLLVRIMMKLIKQINNTIQG